MQQRHLYISGNSASSGIQANNGSIVPWRPHDENVVNSEVEAKMEAGEVRS